MGLWGPDGFYKNKSVVNLEDAVNQLTPKAKQAMYAAAKLGSIAQGTWDGCAFNAAGNIEGDGNVHSLNSAAALFEMTPKEVGDFIRVWDRLKAKSPTSVLMKTIENVGFLTEPVKSNKSFVGTYTTVVHESEASFRDEFDRMIEDLRDLDDFEATSPVASEFREATEEAARALFA